jgi:hypothetical protein
MFSFHTWLRSTQPLFLRLIEARETSALRPGWDPAGPRGEVQIPSRHSPTRLFTAGMIPSLAQASVLALLLTHPGISATRSPSTADLPSQREIETLLNQAEFLFTDESTTGFVLLNQKRVPIKIKRGYRTTVLSISTPRRTGTCWIYQISDPPYRYSELTHLFPETVEDRKTCKEFYGFSGSDLLALTEAIGRAARVKVIELTDVSSRSCPLRSQLLASLDSPSEDSMRPLISRRYEPRSTSAIPAATYSLKIARFFTRGTTWYGSYGYLPAHVSSELFESFADSLRHISLRRYLDCHSKTRYPRRGLLFKLLQEYRSSHPEDSLILMKDFLSWVLKNRCDLFDLLTNVELLRVKIPVPPPAISPFDVSCGNLDIAHGMRLLNRSTAHVRFPLESETEFLNFGQLWKKEIIQFIHDTPFH